MFKENKEFWLYFFGIIILFFFLFFSVRSIISGRQSIFDFFDTPNTSGSRPLVFVTPPETTLDKTKDYTALVKTNRGDFRIDLFEKNAPNTVSNFISLVNNKYYDGTKFHRLVPGVLLQGGSRNTLNNDPNDDKYGGPGYTIPDEIGWDSLDFDQSLRQQLTKEGYKTTPRIASKDIEKYVLAMANSGPNLNGSQFFIILGDKNDPRVKQLRGRHTVFAQVIEGFGVIDQMAKTPVDDASLSSPRPLEDLVINQIQIQVK